MSSIFSVAHGRVNFENNFSITCRQRDEIEELANRNIEELSIEEIKSYLDFIYPPDHGD